jgi:hypothetical protein
VSSHRAWILKTIKRFDMGRSVPDFTATGMSMPMELAPLPASVVPEPMTLGIVALLPLALRRSRARR